LTIIGRNWLNIDRPGIVAQCSSWFAAFPMRNLQNWQNLCGADVTKTQDDTGQRETVGGPIDVAVLSKGDGFVWIKRKSYFDPRLIQGTMCLDVDI